jgi:hypothetical protein
VERRTSYKGEKRKTKRKIKEDFLQSRLKKKT